MVWSTPNDRDAELDQALRELGAEVLEQEVPERLLPEGAGPREQTCARTPFALP